VGLGKRKKAGGNPPALKAFAASKEYLFPLWNNKLAV
jgi:hypothetical protein